ncbi:sulfotransferase family protein [Chelativorans salis]|uniref:Sulfotransferase domain-containing protein n=1 Tax=Chelativorans salis TaxID=2978478 RepID=A0ABT2LQT8_9HYPH|nr:sulfotransferase [Chelativorans sp. EGI FJ00035]MCT7376915.1 sulfotransferase domain-containing protein [Chelativorans sp. EGI FJ00035]
MRLDDIDFLIIGATKSATTWLQKSLQADPTVSMPDPELHYFSREFARGDDWYLAQFPPDADVLVAGEKSNSYLEKPEAAERIARKVPNAKLVVQLRDPVERAYSDYCMLYRRGEVSSDIERYLDPTRSPNTRPISAGLYHRQLHAYFDLFPAERILVTFYEAVTARPEEQFARVSNFLGLPRGEPPSCHLLRSKVKDKSVPMLNPTMRRLLRPLKPVIAPLRETPSFRRVHAAIAKEISYPPFPDSLRQRLIDHYEPDVELLGRLLGRDLSHWLRRSAV